MRRIVAVTMALVLGACGASRQAGSDAAADPARNLPVCTPAPPGDPIPPAPRGTEPMTLAEWAAALQRFERVSLACGSRGTLGARSAAVEAGRLAFDGAAARRCAEHLASADPAGCWGEAPTSDVPALVAELVLATGPCAGVYLPNVSSGGTCRVSWASAVPECAGTDVCVATGDASDPRCACTPSLPLGSPCTSNPPCAAGLVCARSGDGEWRCAERAPPQPGPCGACAPGASCFGPNTSTPVCRPQAGIGGDCYDSADCVGHLLCIGAGRVGGGPGTCGLPVEACGTCVPDAGVIGCGPGLGCDTAHRWCVPWRVAGEGERCPAMSEGKCRDDLWCSAGTCAARLPEGAWCYPSLANCAPGLTCCGHTCCRPEPAPVLSCLE